jgi:peptidyl-prolyl cis-trans isomerase B (cyclophilin B)
MYNVASMTHRAVASRDVLTVFRRMSLVLVVLLAAVVPLGAQPPATQPPATPPPAARQAVITMDKGGQIVLELFTTDAPRHVDNFAKLAARGFYDGQRFHRVEDWVVQVGDPQSKTRPMDFPGMGTGGPGYTIKAELNQRPHERGALGMARSRDPDSAGSQFYILRKPARGLDGQYTVFGRVVRGMDLVDAIKVGDRVKSVKVTD